MRNFFCRWIRKNNPDFSSLLSYPRFTQHTVKLFGKDLKIADSHSFVFMHQEIFIKEIYRLKNTLDNPYFIDAGANIGLSIIYLKLTFSDAKVLAFEPDPEIFKILTFNIKSFNLDEVTLINKALWNNESDIEFFIEGADSGRLHKALKDCRKVKVPATRLRNYLNRKVDFLKIDIEGAELAVLEDSKDLLCNVDHLFIEYHSFTDSPQQLDRLLFILQDEGFRYYIQQIGVESPYPFECFKSFLGMDNQLNIFAIKT